MNLPTSAACQDVPQASSVILSIDVSSASEIAISFRWTCPVSSEARPSTVSRTADGCSKISLSMKCL